MKKMILILLFGCIYCCAFAQQSDSVIIARFANDTAGFRKAAERVNVRGRYERKYRHVKRARIKDDHDAAVWLALNLERGSNFQNPEYKQVEGGWLFVGEYLEPGYWSRRKRSRHIRKYFVGYDHNIVKVADHTFYLPLEFTVEITPDALLCKFPDGTQGTDMIVEPELAYFDGGMDGVAQAIKYNMTWYWEYYYGYGPYRLRSDEKEQPEYPVETNVFNPLKISFEVDARGEFSYTRYPIIDKTVAVYSIDGILSMATREELQSGRWSPGSVNGEAVPVEVSLTVHCTIDRNPEYDKWPHYTWRELLDTQIQNK